MLSLLQDYENDALVHLKRILANKWDFVIMQAEEQVLGDYNLILQKDHGSEMNLL